MRMLCMLIGLLTFGCIHPSIAPARISVPPRSTYLRQLEEVRGQVTAVAAAKDQFTLQIGGSTGQSLTVKVDKKTAFEDFDERGLPNAFSSVAVGQVLEVEGTETSTGVLLAKEIELED